MVEFDDMDMKLLRELTDDGSVSIPNLAKKMGVNSSVLYSRIKRMKEKGLIVRFTIDVDDSILGIGVRATIGINRDPKAKARVHKAILEIPEVTEMAEITGRFDILATLRTSNLESLHAIVIEKIGKIDGVQGTETLVELQKRSRAPQYAQVGEQSSPRSRR